VDYDAVVDIVVPLLNQKKAMNAIKSACDLLAIVSPSFSQTQLAKVNPKAEQLFLERQDCAGNLAKFFALTGNVRMCQFVLISAFDAVNVQMGEQCKLAAPVAARYFNSEQFAEAVDAVLQEEPLVLNGLSRCLFALQFQMRAETKGLWALCERVGAETEDFFEEVQAVYTAYLDVLKGKEADLAEYEHALDSKQEFDPNAYQTATFLKKQWLSYNKKAGLEGIIQSYNETLTTEAKNYCQEILYETTV